MKKAKRKSAPEKKTKSPSDQGSKLSAYGDETAICKNAKCKLRKASCKGFIACPGFKA